MQCTHYVKYGKICLLFAQNGENHLLPVEVVGLASVIVVELFVFLFDKVTSID